MTRTLVLIGFGVIVLAGMGGYGVRAQEHATLAQRLATMEARLATGEANTLPPPSPYIAADGSVTNHAAVLTDPTLDLILVCYAGDPLSHLHLDPLAR